MKRFQTYLAVVLLAFSTASFATSMSFTLGNHGDGAIYDGVTNPYGLRLDDTGQTFTVGDNLPGAFTGASLELSFDPADLAAGALLTGVIIDNATGSAWDVMYTMSDLSAAPNGGFIAQSGSGTLAQQDGEGFFEFIGKSNGTGAFIFDNDGHRLGTDTGWVGRGWVEGAGASNDFLVTAAPVPLPGAIWMMGAGLIGLFGASRRK